MRFYERRILPTLLDKLMTRAETVRMRKTALAPARGRVLEIGFGTGLNVPHYPSTVTHLVGVDPNPGVERLARQRLGAAPMASEFALGPGDNRLPYDDGTFDTVVTTFVLCTVGDVNRALSEIRRVLKADGQYLLLEHGLAPDAGVQRWQQRLNGLNRLILGGCNLNRPIAKLVTGGGFMFQTFNEFFQADAPKFIAWTTSAIAHLERPQSL
jgi:ubiquinone/menaquinone biosynthesis C-methylase UbiE